MGSSGTNGGIQQAIIDWFAVEGRELPWRADDFTPWGNLVSEFMLQQTPVARVLPKLTEWLQRWPTPASLAAASPADVVRAWDRLGYPRRALALHACAVAITQQYDGVVPRDIDQLLALPGIGDYTARAIAVFGYGDRHPVVDTNTRRVIARAVSGQAEAPPPSKRELAVMEALLPTERQAAHDFNAGIMELGALICVARTPRCTECPLSGRCAWQLAGYPASTEAVRKPQARYEGSDRQVRGVVMSALRAAHHPIDRELIEGLWPDAVQLTRAVTGLIVDGLAVETSDGLSLPH